MLLYESYYYIIKYFAIFFIYSGFIFNKYINIDIVQKNIIKIDNKFKTELYENDSSFINYKTILKPIAFYYPEYNNISYLKYFDVHKKLYQFNRTNIEQLIEKQIKLAKNHGIHGFAIYLDLINLQSTHNIISNFFINKTNFPFFLIWKIDDFVYIDAQIVENLINQFKKFIISDNYIKIRNKPVLSISKPENFLNKKEVIPLIRKKALQKKIGDLFIFYPFTGNFTEKKFLSEFDAAYDYSKIDLFEHIIIKPNILYYSGIIYKNLILNELNFNFSLFRNCILNYKNFKDYNPEKFYMANNLIFEWAKINYNLNEGIIFVDSWNNYKDGKYLEKDEQYGYASINSFSKSLFNLPFKENNFSLYSHQNITIAIQVHVFYEDLLKEIIDKLNLIPFKYDLFISTISNEKKDFIKKYLLYSTANNYEIRIFKNIGRDVYPFISQMKSKYKNYKYICHIHTKKSNHKSLLGKNWRKYIYSNLLGSGELISEILFDFENNKKLGFIFPEVYYDLIKDIHGFDYKKFFLNEPNIDYMNFLLKKIFGYVKIGDYFDFPAGNMFWAKIEAIYQIFNIRLRFPKELNQTNQTIMHAVERIWLYLVKLNGYYYKTIMKHY